MPFSYALQHGIGQLIASVNALSPYTATAGGAGDNTQQTGITLDRQSIGREYLSAQVAIPYKATLAAAKKVTVSSIVEDSADGASWATYVTGLSSSVVGSTTSTAAQTLNSALTYNVDLGSARRYVRVDVTADLSAANTDTFAFAAVAALGGQDRI